MYLANYLQPIDCQSKDVYKLHVTSSSQSVSEPHAGLQGAVSRKS